MPTLRQTQLLNYQSVYDAIDHAPGIGVVQIAAAIGRNDSAVRDWVRYMVMSGSLQRVTASQTTYGAAPKSFYAIPKMRPIDLPKIRGKANTSRPKEYKKKDWETNRPRSKAKQIGMQRDPLVAALFGAAVSSGVL